MFYKLSEAVKDNVFHAMTEISCEQRADDTLQHFVSGSNEFYYARVIDNTELLVYMVKHLIIPKVLQRITVAWYHQYLQYPGHTCLEGTLKSLLDNNIQEYMRYKTYSTC